MVLAHKQSPLHSNPHLHHPNKTCVALTITNNILTQPPSVIQRVVEPWILSATQIQPCTSFHLSTLHQPTPASTQESYTIPLALFNGFQ